MTTYEADAFWGGVCGWLALVAIATLLVAIPIDSQGRDPEAHTGPVPAHVYELTPTAYLVDDESALGFCRGTGGETGSPTRTTVHVPRLEALYVECVTPQHWNAKGELSKGYGSALMTILTTPIAWAVAALVLILCLLPYNSRRRDRRRREKNERAARALAQKNQLDIREEKRQALATSYAKGEISELEFETALEKVLR